MVLRTRDLRCGPAGPHGVQALVRRLPRRCDAIRVRQWQRHSVPEHHRTRDA